MVCLPSIDFDYMTREEPKTSKEPSNPPHIRAFERCDWRAFWLTTIIAFLGYLWTLAPNLTLLDSGELAVAAHYAGVPHPPGYPIWTLYSWMFTKLLPFSNTAWRVSVSSAVAAAFAAGLISLIVSRWSRLVVDGIKRATAYSPQLNHSASFVAGTVAGLLYAFNGFTWSQAIIVEVYALSAFTFIATITLLFVWAMNPDRKRWLYAAFFMYGVAITNHQTLVVGAMGLEILIAIIRPKLGRDLFLGNTFVYGLVLVLMAFDKVSMFDNSAVLLWMFQVIGIASFVTWLLMAHYTGLFRSIADAAENGKLGDYVLSTLRRLLMLIGLAVCVVLPQVSNLYLPIASMTNPPMNWGYPRTVDGFQRLISRGQYAPTSPTEDPLLYARQITMYWEGVFREFSLAFTFLAAVPFFLVHKMTRRDRGVLLGSFGMFFGLSAILVALLNPSADQQSMELNKVFFTFSHLFIAIWIGLALSLAIHMINAHREELRMPILIVASMTTGAALFETARVFQLYQYFYTQFAYVWVLFLCGAFVAILLRYSQSEKPPPALPFLILIGLMPIYSVTAHWSDNEKRGHLFGYWFGHDMFTPPFDLYPEMERDAILFGGTDPGRFCPTYMIFVESFLPSNKKLDSDFDRRDVYLITQNALADDTYMATMRAFYNRSEQVDPPFFQNFFPFGGKPLDNLFMEIGADIEAKRRERGVYPEKEIQIPSNNELSQAYQEYVADAYRRMQTNQLKPGEILEPTDDGGVVPKGQASVMGINGILAKMIFEKNPDHAFYIEESFPIDWMYPHLAPFGIIMEIRREPIQELTQEELDINHEFWRKYSARLSGDWITYETTVDELVAYADEYFFSRNLKTFPGDPKFARDIEAQKSFSKLRGAQAELLRWRWANTESEEERERLEKEADFAFKQSFAYYPQSPETVSRYANFLSNTGRHNESLKLVQIALKLDPDSDYMHNFARMITQQGQALDANPSAVVTSEQLQELRAKYEQTPSDPTNSMALVNAYIARDMTNQALRTLDQIVAHPESEKLLITAAAEIIASVFLDVPRLETALIRLTQVAPTSPEAFYDLAAIRVVSGAVEPSMDALKTALELNQTRLESNPDARDIREDLKKDPRFDVIRDLPIFQETISGY